jgi:hypothetical protein
MKAKPNHFRGNHHSGADDIPDAGHKEESEPPAEYRNGLASYSCRYRGCHRLPMAFWDFLLQSDDYHCILNRLILMEMAVRKYITEVL